MFRVLFVEDAIEYQKIISYTLNEYVLTCASTVSEASAFLKSKEFDLILVDITLPDRDGYTLLAEIQSNPSTANIPVLCLSERNEITDKVTAFSLGADDYITKPFDPLELRVRVETRLKKIARKKEEDRITIIGEIEIDHARHRVMIGPKNNRREVEVTQTEFKILCSLARRPDQVYTRDQLLVAAWGEDANVLDRVVDTHVCLLRKKLGVCSNYIKAVKGVGYKISPKLTNKDRSAQIGHNEKIDYKINDQDAF